MTHDLSAWKRAALLVSLVTITCVAGLTSRAADKAQVRFALAGDSTVAVKSGWGPGFEKLLGPGTVCTNYARGGRSSKSYRDEGHWKLLLAWKPDYVLIQFGHNDMPGKGPERETDPKTTFPENLARYVDEARAIGARPILVTSLTRRLFTDDGKIQGELSPWVEATRRVAAGKKVPLVDLFARSVALHEKLGPEGSAPFEPPGKDGKPDHTHLNEKGAEEIAALVADELRKVAPELGKLLKK